MSNHKCFKCKGSGIQAGPGEYTHEPCDECKDDNDAREKLSASFEQAMHEYHGQIVEKLSASFEQAMHEYHGQIVMGTSIADIFYAGYKAGFTEGRKEAYRAITKAFDAINAV